MTFLAGVVIAVPFVVLILLWGFGVIPTRALLPLLTAPLAVRLGEILSPRSGASRQAKQRELLVFAGLFLALLVLGAALPL